MLWHLIWPVPEAAVTVWCTPDDGCDGHPKRVEYSYSLPTFGWTYCFLLRGIYVTYVTSPELLTASLKYEHKLKLHRIIATSTGCKFNVRLGRRTDSGSCRALSLVENFFPPVVRYTNTNLLAPNDSGLIKSSQLCPLVSCYLVSYKNKKKIVCECGVWLNETRNIRQHSLSLVYHNTANTGKLKWSIPVSYKAQLQTAKSNLSIFMLRREMGKWKCSSTHSKLLH